MILYDTRAAIVLSDFGIMIPALASRPLQILSDLGVDDLTAPPAWLETAIDATIGRADLERVHGKDFLDRLYGGEASLTGELMKAYELVKPDGTYHRYEPARAVRPITELFQTILLQLSGTYQSCLRALDGGFHYFLGGGHHHAHRDFGWGFCLLNDIVVAARRLIAERKVTRVWVIDIDAHKGDGTAELTAGDAAIRSLSVHMGQGWPLDAQALAETGHSHPCLAPSAIDVPILSGEEGVYLDRLHDALLGLVALDGRPADLAIVVDGSDPWEHDGLPSSSPLRLTLEQCLERDQLVLEFLKALGIPSCWVMSGGYGDRAWEVHAGFLKSLAR